MFLLLEFHFQWTDHEIFGIGIKRSYHEWPVTHGLHLRVLSCPEIFLSWLKNARIFWRIIIAKSGNTGLIKFVCRSRLWFGCGFSLFVWISVFDKNSLHFQDQMVLLVRKISFVYQLLQHVANWSLTSLQQSFLVRLLLDIQGFFYQ